MLESQPPIRFSEQLLGANARMYSTISNKHCKDIYNNKNGRAMLIR